MKRSLSLSRSPLVPSILLATAIGCAAAPGEPSRITGAKIDGASAVRIVSVASGKALDVTGASADDGAPVQQWEYGGGANQQWVMHDAGGGAYTIVNVHSGKCLDVAAMSGDDGAHLQQWSCSGGTNQSFALRAASDGSYDLVGVGSGKCVDVAAADTADGAVIQQWGCAGSANQRWRVESVDAPQTGGDPTNGAAAVVITSAASGKVLDVAAASPADGAPIQQWSVSGGTNQQWRVKEDGQGHFTIASVESGKCLDVVGASNEDGARLQQWSCAGAANQAFTFVAAPNGAYALVSAASGKCLDLAGGSDADGMFVQEWSCSGAPNQQWLLSGVTPTAPPPVASLRDASARSGRYIGAALSASHLDDAGYVATAAREFDALTPENEMKWDATEPEAGQFSFAGGDALVAFAAQHGMKVKGHTLVWHNQLPGWVSALSSPDAVRAAMTSHITTVASHYRGKVFAWDVVNEAIDDGNGNVIRDDVFHRALGDAYIAEAFRIAHQVDPDALLFYNDYGIEGMGGKADAAYALARRLVAEGVPISGIGLQMHVGAGANEGPSAADVAANIHRIAALGLRVNVSEMDVGVCAVPGDRAAKFEAQRARMHDLVAACMSEARCVGVTVWGVTDKLSWLNGFAPCGQGQTGSPWGLAFDDDYARKPAWQGLVDALLGR